MTLGSLRLGPLGLGPLRVAAVQATSVAGDVEANVASAVHWVGVAAQRGARVVVLPELFLTGYDPATWKADGCDVTVHDERLLPLTRAAEAAGTAILIGAAVGAVVGAGVDAPVDSGGERTLSTLCCSPDGAVDVVYSKQHLWQEERSVFTPGDAGGSVVLDGWHLGLGICYDGCFPEHARAAADAGALAYLCPSAYVIGSEHRRDLYYAARALDNGVYVVLAGLTGRCGDLSFSGGTSIYDPQGRRVAGVPSGEGLAVADLDPVEIAEARAINPYAEDRPASLGGRLVTRL